MIRGKKEYNILSFFKNFKFFILHIIFCRCNKRLFFHREYFQLPASHTIYTRNRFSVYGCQDYYSLYVAHHRHVCRRWTCRPTMLRACAMHFRLTQRNATQRDDVVCTWMVVSWRSYCQVIDDSIQRTYDLRSRSSNIIANEICVYNRKSYFRHYRINN